MGSKHLHLWFAVILASLPFLVSGMEQGWAFAWRSLMAAEIYVTIWTGFGLGQLLHFGRELNAMDQVIGIVFVIVIVGLRVDKILFSPWESFLHRRWEKPEPDRKDGIGASSFWRPSRNYLGRLNQLIS